MTSPCRAQNESHKLLTPPGRSARGRGCACFGTSVDWGHTTVLPASAEAARLKRSQASRLRFRSGEMYLQLLTNMHNRFVSFCIADCADSLAKYLSKNVDICTKRGVVSHIDPVIDLLCPVCVWGVGAGSSRSGAIGRGACRSCGGPIVGRRRAKKHSQCAEKTEQLCFKETT